MLLKFKEHIEKEFPELVHDHFLIACSGGLDSMVLTHLCYGSKLKFSIAHCNFRLRGSASDGDEIFVEQFAASIDSALYVTHFDTLGYVNQHKVSVQMACRDLRYTWFDQLLKQHKIPYLLTAHHANDNLETFLINLSRGTGIDGLTGIPQKLNHLRRPLLPFSREELEAYAKTENLSWREDASNADTKYLRNKIRLEIIPRLQELHPSFLANFQNTQDYLNQTKILSDQYLKQLKEELFISENGKFRISLESLTTFAPLDAILYGLFNEYGFTEWENVLDLLNAMSGKQLMSKTHILLKDRESLWLAPYDVNAGELEEYEIDESQNTLNAPIKLNIKPVKERSENSTNEIFVQKESLTYPLVVRKWKKGDYFHPLGFIGKKKLSKYFKDVKMNLLEKEEQWLLCSNNQIVWVIGKRADRRFKVDESSQNIVKIELIK
ncbi:MAG: tRNA lysidine(34) synthetase TilS [Maribacter sp.]